MSKSNLNNYVCTYPFNYLDIQENTSWPCCPSWVTKHIGDYNNNQDPDLSGLWKGQDAEDFRRSVTDGSYKFCKSDVCPFLNYVVNNDKPYGPIVYRDAFESLTLPEYPEEILFGFDRACNLKCPSCRVDYVTNDANGSLERSRKENIMAHIDKHFSQDVKKMLITGSGDPIYSKIYRQYLQDFDKSKYPKLETIQLITNGNLLNEKMWNTLKAREFIKFIEISVDAGTLQTYEDITRLNGNWEKLTENIKFLMGQPEIEEMVFSMVVNEYNYKEMEQFYDYIRELEKTNRRGDKRINIRYMKIQYWGTGAYLPEDIRNISIFDRPHPKFESFMTEFNKIKDKPRVHHNFHSLL